MPRTDVKRQLTVEQQELVVANQRLAWSIAKQVNYQLYRTPFQELVSEALVGLTYAASLYTSERGIPFGNYAAMVIRHKLYRFCKVYDRSQFARMPVDSNGEEIQFGKADTVEANLAAADLCQLLKGRLPSRWYAMLWMRTVDGCDYRAISAHFGISRQRAYQLIVKAMTRAKKILAEQENAS